ncbi:dihydropteroate synthase [Marinomonas agarivorans]|nr:dihydropteroate synthase [Marinomonas agarivorans]
MSFVSFGDKSLDLSRPHVMGILNVTPDSFSDGGAFTNLDKALLQTQRMIAEGASIIDVGGESTRPGAKPVSQQEELQRVVPVVEAIKQRFDTIVSVDTSTPEVMQESIKQGAGFINDVRALTREGALDVVCQSGLPVCLMHMQGAPSDMQRNPSYSSVCHDVFAFLLERAELCLSLGIDRKSIILDPGIGFGKKLDHNLALINNLRYLVDKGYEVLMGASRKSMIGDVLNVEVEHRMYGSMGVNASAYANGARLFRVHDVKAHWEMLELMYRIEREK